jgi:hypothetical protein
MPKTMRESRMLELVRRWRAEAFESMRRESWGARRRRTAEWARRLNLPVLDEDEQAEQGPRPANSQQNRIQ